MSAGFVFGNLLLEISASVLLGIGVGFAAHYFRLLHRAATLQKVRARPRLHSHRRY